ncbi:hypothetical protein EIK79_15900 [Halocatena pleomorpha]|uniref:Methanogenesis regulatory protein FilR1 middle domain-containing protein n=1 Tax=Halocatena pleomorpha TaxID=1785090 RepID=A0A3P3R4A9_9EURY|nr:hypothetical protein [Halocatena pleomorpha]RRJ28327.1 hypothetical protein EIK79_15900 [Halocatena pleomorpha]
MSGLESANIVDRTTDGYRLTAFGELLSQLRKSYLRSLETIHRAQAMQTPLPIDQYGEKILFDGGNVVLPEPHLPEKPTRRILSLITDSCAVYGFTPVIHDQYISTSYEQVMMHDLEFEFLITSQIFDGLVSLYSEWLINAFQRDAFVIYECQQLPPFGLAIFERKSDGSHTVVLALYADNGLSGIIENDTRRAVGWAKQLYRDYRAAATHIDTDHVRKTLDSEQP